MTTTPEQQAELTLNRRLSHLQYSRDEKRSSKALEFIDAEISALGVAIVVIRESREMRELLAEIAAGDRDGADAHDYLESKEKT